MEYYQNTDPGFYSRGPGALVSSQQAGLAAGIDIAYFSLAADAEAADAPVAGVLRLPPHGVLQRHSHPCYRVEVVVSGSIDTGTAVLTAGDVMTSAPGECYGPHTAGPDGCVSVEMFSRLDGVRSTLRPQD